MGEVFQPRSEEAVSELKSGRKGIWPGIRWIHRRRPLLTAILVLAAPVHTLVTEAAPLDLLDPSLDVRFVLGWGLMLFGVAVRLWGAGNLSKNQEITRTGVYVMVRHPLYLGSLSLFLAYFLTVGDVVVGLVLFGLMVGLVFYPTMLAEEEYLGFKFPDEFSGYNPPPRLLPDLTRIPEALRSDRFDARAANRNLGFRGIWFLLALPLFLKLLELAERAI